MFVVYSIARRMRRKSTRDISCATVHSLVYRTTAWTGICSCCKFCVKVRLYQDGGVSRNGDEQHAGINLASESSSYAH